MKESEFAFGGRNKTASLGLALTLQPSLLLKIGVSGGKESRGIMETKNL